jgi:hypothetical protein
VLQPAYFNTLFVASFDCHESTLMRTEEKEQHIFARNKNIPAWFPKLPNKLFLEILYFELRLFTFVHKAKGDKICHFPQIPKKNPVVDTAEV